MCHQQKKPDSLQGVSSPKVPLSGNVEKRLPLRSSFQLVQDPLPPSGATTTAASRHEYATKHKTPTKDAAASPPTPRHGFAWSRLVPATSPAFA